MFYAGWWPHGLQQLQHEPNRLVGTDILIVYYRYLYHCCGTGSLRIKTNFPNSNFLLRKRPPYFGCGSDYTFSLFQRRFHVFLLVPAPCLVRSCVPVSAKYLLFLRKSMWQPQNYIKKVTYTIVLLETVVRIHTVQIWRKKKSESWSRKLKLLIPGPQTNIGFYGSGSATP